MWHRRLGPTVGVVIKYMHDPGQGYWQTVKWIQSYLFKTVDVDLVFERDDPCDQYVIGFVDLDCAGDLDKRRSITGYVFILSGAPVSWKSTLQSIVALSTIEAEYLALIEAIKEAIWLGRLLDELGVGQKQISIYYDSPSAICLAKNPVFHVCTKHINVRYHFV